MSPWNPFSRRRTSLLPHVTVLQGALEDLALLMHLCLEKNGVAMGGPWAGAALRDWVCTRQSWSSLRKPQVFIHWGKKLVNAFQKPHMEQIRKKKIKNSTDLEERNSLHIGSRKHGVHAEQKPQCPLKPCGGSSEAPSALWCDGCQKNSNVAGLAC